MGLRWLLVMLIALFVFSFLHDWLAKVGLGRLPGTAFGLEFWPCGQQRPTDGEHGRYWTLACSCACVSGSW